MEVTVATVHEPSCFVSVPQGLLEMVYEEDFETPLILELTKGKGSGKHYAVWGGATSQLSHLEVPKALAECMGILDGDYLRVRACTRVPYATTVEVEPATPDDWEILELNQAYLEEQILNQLGVVKEGAVFPVWLHSRDKLLLRVVKASPAPLVRLMTGVELIVAPKERAKKQAAGKSTEPTDEQSSGVWLRVQEANPALSAVVKLGEAVFKSLPTTKAFISPLTAEEAGFQDGQLGVLSAAFPKPVAKDDDNTSGPRAGLANRTQDAGGEGEEQHAALGGMERGSLAADFASTNDRPERVAVVTVRVSRLVARGHAMMSSPLRQQLGAKLMSRVSLKHCSAHPTVMEIGQITIHPLVLSQEPSRFDPRHKGDLPSVGSYNHSSWQKPIGRNQPVPQGATVGFHRHLLSLASAASPDPSLRKGSRSAAATRKSPAQTASNGKATTTSATTRSGFDRILNQWLLSLEQRAGEAPPSLTKAGVPVTDGTVMHLAVLDPRPKGQTGGGELHPPTEISSRWGGKPKEALFVIRVRSDTGSQEGRTKRSGSGGTAPFFALLSPLECAELARCVPGKTLVWEEEEDLGADAEEPTVESLGWLANPAKVALGGLNAVLSVRAKRLLRTLGTPSPGSVLVYGPQASGKTRLVRALARHLREDPSCLANSVFVECSELVGELPGVATARLHRAIEEAVQCAPSLIILDDIDALLPAAEQEGVPPGMSLSGQAPLAEYLADMMDTCQAATCAAAHLPAWRSRFSSVAFLGVAGSPSSLAKQLCSSGRFDLHVELPAPAEAERANILAGFVASRHLHCLPSVVATAAARCTGFDISDLDILVERALHAAAVRHLASDSGSMAAAVASSLPAQESTAGDVAASRMMVPRLELADADFEAALEGFVPVAMRGIGTKTSSATGPKCGWDDVGGLEEARRALQEVLELPAKHAKLFSSAPLRLRSGVLLYGPPGCGKTHLVGAAAAACGLRFISVKGPELLNKYIGASEQAVRDVFARAAAASPCMLFFDEFDAIAPKRGHDNTGVTDRVVNQLLTELDGVEALTGVFVIAATSRPDLIDAALLRPGRLDQLLMCDFPVLDERRQILLALARQLEMGEDADLARIAAFTDGFSGADLQALLSDAQLAAVHEALDSLPGGSTGQAGGELTVSIRAAHLESALRTARPSVPESERTRLCAIYDQFHASRTASTASVSQQAKGKRATLA